MSSLLHGREESATTRSVITVGLLCTVVLSGCGDPPDPRSDDVPTRGHILILADEDLRDLVQAEEYMFESIYRDAQLDIRYLPEAELLKAVMNDSVRCWIGTVQPGGEQEAYYAKRSVKAHVVPIAMDGIAVVVNPAIGLTGLSVGEVLHALTFPESFKADNWSISAKEGPMDQPRPWFASAGSGVARSLIDSLVGPVAEQRIVAMADPDLPSLIGRIANDPEAIGFLSFSSVSDLDNPKMKGFRDQVKLLAISASDSTAAVLPNQSTLADGSYPLRRPVYMVLCEGKSGLGTGFVSFVANHKGQRIILKHGIAPNKVPPREVEIVSQ